MRGETMHCLKNRIYTITLILCTLCSHLLGGIAQGHFCSPSIGYAADSNGRILKTSDGGASWSVVYYLPECSFLNVHFLNDHLGYAGGCFGSPGCSQGVFIKTTDGGLSWSLHTVSANPGCEVWYRNSDIIAVDEQTAIFADTQRESWFDNTRIYKTDDGAQNWHLVKSDLAGEVRFTFRDSLTGFGIQYNPSDTGADVYRTLDGGDSWHTALDTSAGIMGWKAIEFLNDTVAYAVGDVRYFCKTTNGGDTWNVYPTGNAYKYAWLNDLEILNDSTVVAVGETGRFFRTLDGGKTWTFENLYSEDLQSIKIFNDTTWIVVGVYTVLRSENGGESWDIYPNVLTWTETMSDPHPQQYRLYPNFPNPFNPTTLLRYDLPQASEVSLIVYNLLGQNVTTLTEGYVQPGHHEAVWDASTYPSGIYIARLVTSGYCDAIKMLLLK